MKIQYIFEKKSVFISLLVTFSCQIKNIFADYFALKWNNIVRIRYYEKDAILLEISCIFGINLKFSYNEQIVSKLNKIKV